jgi:hypothetical protein
MTVPRPVIVITGRQRPHERALSIIAVLLGGLYVAGEFLGPVRVSPPRAIAGFLGAWAVGPWAVVMLAGGVACLAGSYWPGRHDVGLKVEQASQLAQAAATMLVAVGALVVAGVGGIVGAAAFGAWSWACLERTWGIGKDLQGIEKASAPRRE